MGIKMIKLDSTVSTNSHIAEMIKQGKVDYELVVIADYQENGRGQGDHSWHSRKGENLLLSLLLFPAFLSASEQFQLSRLAALALCDTLEHYHVAPLIKWPNDIMVNHRKIAGLLLEHGIKGGRLSHTIIGIGLNLNQSTFPDFPVKATSLALETGETGDPEFYSEILINRIMERYGSLKGGDSGELEEEYHNRLYMVDRPGTFRFRTGEVSGVIRGVNRLGELLVEIEGRVVACNHQEIALVK